MPDKQTIDVYEEWAATYAERFSGKSSPENELLAGFLKGLAPGAAVLDLGCGPGHFAAWMVKAGFDVTGSDASPAMVELARHSGAKILLQSFDDLQQVAEFDGVWANFSLLHAPRADLGGHIDAIARALRPQGRFHIAMKSGVGEKRDKLGRRYTFVSEAELKTLLDQAGFIVEQCTTGEGPGLDGTVAPWIAMQARLA